MIHYSKEWIDSCHLLILFHETSYQKNQNESIRGSWESELNWISTISDLNELPLGADVAVAAPDDVDVALAVKLLRAALLPVRPVVLGEAEIDWILSLQ